MLLAMAVCRCRARAASLMFWRPYTAVLVIRRVGVCRSRGTSCDQTTMFRKIQSALEPHGRPQARRPVKLSSTDVCNIDPTGELDPSSYTERTMRDEASPAHALQSSVPGDHPALRTLSVPCLAHVAWVPLCPLCAELPQAHSVVCRCGNPDNGYY